jgi:hypothetical protein
MREYSAADANPMSWVEFENLADSLVSQLKDYFKSRGEAIDAITPLHRTGGIVGGLLAIKLEVVPILPAQFKYSYNPTKINQISTLPDLLVDLPKSPNIIFCEGNTSSGSISKAAAKLVKEKYPDSKIYLATLTKVFGGPEALENIEKIFYGRLTNEGFKATPEEVKALNMREGVTIFPWEKTESEIADINAAA